MNLFTSQFSEIEIVYKNKMLHRDMRKITSSKDAYEVFAEVLANRIDHKEFFYILLLSRANKVLGFHKVSEGGLSGTVADPKVIFQTALKANSCSIILGHNHPSGNTVPSKADILLTKRIENHVNLFNIELSGHIVINKEGSFLKIDIG